MNEAGPWRFKYQLSEEQMKAVGTEIHRKIHGEIITIGVDKNDSIVELIGDKGMELHLVDGNGLSNSELALLFPVDHLKILGKLCIFVGSLIDMGTIPKATM